MTCKRIELLLAALSTFSAQPLPVALIRHFNCIISGAKQLIMPLTNFSQKLLLFLCLSLSFFTGLAQPSFNLKLKKSSLYAGIEVGSKGVKMSLLEVGLNN